MILGHALRRAARLWPRKMAVIDGAARLTYGELAARVDRLAAGLRDAGLGPGGRVALLMSNNFRYVELYFAITAAGGVAVPLNTSLATDELAFLLDDSGSALLAVTREFVAPARRLARRCPALGGIILVDDGAADDGLLAYEALLRPVGAPGSSSEVVETDLAAIFYTSGTTGRPKGAMLTHRNLVDNSYRAIIELGIGESDIHLHAAPLFATGVAALAFAVTCAGGTHVCAGAFDPATTLAAIERERVTCTLLVPAMLRALLDHPDRATRDLASLRAITYGAAPMPPALLREALRALPCRYAQMYGVTEAAPILAILPPADHQADGPAHAPRRLRSLGRAALGIDLRVVDAQGREVTPGTPGEIVARGANTMRGYWNRPTETAATVRNGWLHTGDLATIDEEGYLFLVDRRGDLITSGGRWISSIAVEAALLVHHAVLEAAAIGLPDATLGEVVAAIVVPRPGHVVAGDELVAHCRRHLPAHAVPRSVRFVEALPKNGLGKILKAELRARSPVAARDRLVTTSPARTT